MHPNSSTNPYKPAVDLLSNILDAYTTAFFIVDPKSRRLRMAASQTMSKHLSENIALPLEQSGILAQVYKVGQTIHMDKLQELSTPLSLTLPFYREGEALIKGLFVTPVKEEGGAGVLYADTKHGWGFNDKQQKWILDVASLLHEIWVHQSRLDEQQEQSGILELWQRLDEAAFTSGSSFTDYCHLLIQECARFLGVDYGFVALREPGAQDFRLLAATSNAPRNLLSHSFLLKQGLVGWMLQNQKPLFISRLNAQDDNHFLFSPSEGLPHYGTLWGLPARMALGHALALVFLSKQSVEWNSAYQNTMVRLLHFLQLLLDQLYFKEECEHLHLYDLSTGLYNTMTFEARLDRVLADSLQSSTPLTLALLQFEPWQILSSKTPPQYVRQWQQDLASMLCESLSDHVLLGQLAENRFGLLFPGLMPQEAKSLLDRHAHFGQGTMAVRLKENRLKPYLSMVGFPQDGTRSDELWPMAYRRLFASFRSRTAHMET